MKSRLRFRIEAAESALALGCTVCSLSKTYGSSALSGVEHLTLLVGRKSVALALIRHFGSLKAITRAGNAIAGERLAATALFPLPSSALTQSF
jgi:hypothetical protein